MREGWCYKRIKDVGEINQKQLSDKTANDYRFQYIDIGSVSNIGKIEIGDFITYDIAPSRAKRIVCQNDIIISTVRTYLKAIAFICWDVKDVIVSTGFCVLSLKKTVYPSFVYYYVRNDDFVELICANSKGVSYPSINSSEIASLPISIPPLSTQIIIADYLDKKTAQIDSQIALLEKKRDAYSRIKKSLIHKVITKGLNPDVELKDSGIDWLGEIPKHWEVKRMKDTSFLKARIGWQNLRNNEFVDNTDWLCVTGQDFVDGGVDWRTCYCIEEDRYEQDKNIQLQVGDLLLTKDGTIGKVAYISELPQKATLNSGVFVIRPLHSAYINKFMYWVLNSSCFVLFIDYFKNGSTVLHLYQNVFERFSFPIPTLTEQQQIADYLDHQTNKIDTIVSTINTQIAKSQTLRKSLINEVVTGERSIV